MNIDRLDLDGVGSPAAIAARIHELERMPGEVPLEELCRQLDIRSIGELATEGFEAALLMDEHKAAGSILVAAGRPQARRRYSIAHELGHFLIPAHRPHGGERFECSLADLHLLDPKDRDRRRRTEAEANKFAAHLLMPRARVRAALRQGTSSLEHLCAMARELGVSKEAMARAWAEHHREPVAVMIAHHGRVLRQYRGEDFPWLPYRHGRGLPEESLAAANLVQGHFSPIEEIDADVWLAERDARKVLCLTEQVLGQRDGYALILLQAELDEDEDQDL